MTMRKKKKEDQTQYGEHLRAIFQANDLRETIATLNDYLAFDYNLPPISDNQEDYDLKTTTSLITFLNTEVEWCGIENPRDAIYFIEEEAWDKFISENPGLTSGNEPQ